MNFKSIYLALVGALALGDLQAAEPPAPCGAVPTEQQVQWLRMEWYAFVHFSLNTYTGKEWGYGDESPTLFNPSNFDADAIVTTFKEAGMSGMIYTAKHHDGWCSWPTKSTKHNITQSPWKHGKGDMVKEFSTACNKHGIKFGVYISPWDRNCADYGNPKYLKVYYKQIEELLSNYGPIFEIWFDGANGGDGYYGGAKQKRNIGNADTYYNFTQVVKNIRKLQPDCIIWGAAGRGDVTWGGSEQGHVKYPCWNVVNKDKPDEKWLSLEGDTPINGAGWFWHPGQESKVKSPEKLMQVYFDSVGRGANLILNVAPNRDGRLDPADVESLLAFGEMRRRLLAVDYAQGAQAEASEVRGGDPKFGADKVTDGDIESYWCPNDGTTTGTVTITMAQPATFDVVRLREQIRLGQRVSGFTVEAEVDGQWVMLIPNGQTIGNQIMWKLDAPVTCKKVRFTITASRACPCISEFSLLRMPKSMPRPEASYSNGKVTIAENPSYTILYTTNGDHPAKSGKVYKGAITLPEAPTHPVKAVFRDDSDNSYGPVVQIPIPIATTAWKLVEGNAKAAIDGNPDTIWKADKAPASFTIDMGKVHTIGSFSYTPRQDGKTKGMTDRYILEVSVDGQTWATVSKGEFSNLRANPIEQTMVFTPKKARYVRFTAQRALEGKGVTVAEFKVFAAPKADKKDKSQDKQPKKKKQKKQAA